MTDKGICDECGCSADNRCADYEENHITLEFDDGVEIVCEVMGVFDLDEKEYIALLPEDGSDDVYIYGYKDSDDEFELVDIDDDAEFERVVAEFERLRKELEDELDNEE